MANKKIAFLGPKGSYTEIAAKIAVKELNSKEFDLEEKSSIIKVIEEVDKYNGCLGVVPIENSIEGIVRETVDNLVKTTSRVVIIKEIILPISHCLLSKFNDIKTVKKIYSHPQALAQCSHYISNNFAENIEIIKTSSTSEAARIASNENETSAAIASEYAAEYFNLNILAKKINDEKDNLTRFVCLGDKMPEATGNDKTTIAFTTANTAGALVDVLQEFKSNNINLSYIESRPSKKVFGDYTFFIEFDGHISDEKIRHTIGKIIQNISFYRILGSYPKALTF